MVTLYRVVTTPVDDDDDTLEDWSDEAENLVTLYEQVPAAPDVPSAAPDSSAFAQLTTPSTSIPDGQPPALVPGPTPVASGPPPIPAEGLPPGWTIEQWNHYGDEWLRKQGQ